MIKKAIVYLPLILACCFTIMLVVPAIRANIEDPNMLVYFSADEGGQMDIIWKYYTGERRETFQWDYDYGLELFYFARFCRVFLSGFIDFTPGTFVFILRWAHLIAWLFAFVALWRLVIRHFESSWQAGLAVLLLAVRPAVAYFSTNIKPEPLLALLLIIGVDYSLRIIDDPYKKTNILIAIFCASAAFIVKFAGLFLIPVIAFSMYAAKRYSGSPVFRETKISWMLEMFAGLALVVLLCISIAFYIRRSTGMSFYGEFGLIGSLRQNKLFLPVLFAGLLLIVSSFAILILNKTVRYKKNAALRLVNESNSSLMAVSAIFIPLTLLLGAGWILHPKYFVETYSEFGSIFLGGEIVKTVSAGNMAEILAHKIVERVLAMDAIILVLFLVYAVLEYRNRRVKEGHSKKFIKRMVLLAFLIPLLPAMISLGRFEQHNMMPFFFIMSILALQGIGMLRSDNSIKEQWRKVAITSAALLLCVDIAANASYLIKERMYVSDQKYDVSHEIGGWLKENVDDDAVIAAGHYIHVYIPARFKNVKIFEGYGKDSVKELRNIVNAYKPSIIYYNAGPSGDEPLPPIGKMLPGVKVRLLKEFDSAGRIYQRKAGDRFLVYEVEYQ